MANVGILRQGKLFRTNGDRVRRNALSNIFIGLSSEEIHRLYNIKHPEGASSSSAVSPEVPAQKLQALSLADNSPRAGKKKLRHQNSVSLLRMRESKREEFGE